MISNEFTWRVRYENFSPINSEISHWREFDCVFNLAHFLITAPKYHTDLWGTFDYNYNIYFNGYLI